MSEWTHQLIRTREYLSTEYGPGRRIRVTAGLHQIGAQRPYFSVTADIFRPGARDIDAGGCLHKEILKYWQELAPIVALHLSDDVGAPMHSEANGWYWLAGALGGMGERYHGGNSDPVRSAAECLKIFADHCRITLEEAERITAQVSAATGLTAVRDGPTLIAAPVDRVVARPRWKAICASMVERWQREAQEGIALLDKLIAEGAAL